jgi:hypothetical protein
VLCVLLGDLSVCWSGVLRRVLSGVIFDRLQRDSRSPALPADGFTGGVSVSVQRLPECLLAHRFGAVADPPLLPRVVQLRMAAICHVRSRRTGGLSVP